MKKQLALLLAVWMMLCSAFSLAEGIVPTATEAENTVTEGQGAEWTVMIYLCGTDLESTPGMGGMASGNLAEIAQTKPTDSVNVVLQTGGTKQWYAQGVGLDINPKKLQRYSYNQNGYTLIEEAPLQNMASADTLSDFLSWGKKTYPAEKYMLVLWDHGGGSVTGLIVDELHDNAVMSLDELQRGLEQSGVQLEALLLDTCLMATLETAQAAQSTTHYMIASQESVPGQGTDYKSWLQKLYDDPDCDGQRFGRKLCDAVQQKYAELNDEYSSKFLTYSVIDLTKLDAVNVSWTAPQWVYEKTARLPEVSYDDYMVEAETSIVDGNLHLTITNAKDAVTAVDAVIYQNDPDSGEWIKLGSSWDVSGNFAEGEFAANFGGYWAALNGRFCQMSVQEEADTYILYNIPAYIEDYKATNLRAALMLYTPLSQQAEALSQSDTAETEESAAQDAPSQTLDSSVQPQEDDQADGAGFMLDGPDVDGVDLSTLDPNGYYQLFGVYCDMDTALNMPGRDTFAMQELAGRKMALLMTAVDIETGDDLGTGMGEMFDITDNMVMDAQALPKGTYAFSFEVKSVLGKTLTTKPVTFTWDGEKATFEQESEK